MRLRKIFSSGSEGTVDQGSSRPGEIVCEDQATRIACLFHPTVPVQVDELVRSKISSSGLPNMWNRSIEMVPDCGRGGYRGELLYWLLIVFFTTTTD